MDRKKLRFLCALLVHSEQFYPEAENLQLR